MFIRTLSMLLLAAMPLVAVTPNQGSLLKMDERACHKKSKCQEAILIDHSPYIISSPGDYKLCTNLKHSDPSTPAITILANSVTLDLNQHTIDLKGKGLIGIQIGDGSRVNEDITVINGTIKNGPVTQALAISNDFFYPLVATTAAYPDGLPQGTNDTYPTPTFNFTTAAILADSLNGAYFADLTINDVLYGIVVTTPFTSTNTFGHIIIDRVNIFDFGASYPSAVTVTDVAYGSGVVLFGTPTNPLVDLRLTNSNLTSLNSKFSSQVFSADGIYWNNILATANAGPVASTVNPPPAGSPLLVPLIQGPISFVNCSDGIVRECAAHNSNTLFEAQYCTGFDFIDNQGWGTFHNGIGILFDTDVVVENNIIHRAEGPYVVGGPVQAGSGIKINISNYVLVQNNVFTGFDVLGTATDSNGAGIATAASNYSTIIGNNVAGNNYGIKEIYTTALGTYHFYADVTATSPYYMTNMYYSNNANGNFVANYAFATSGVNSPTNPFSTAVVVHTTDNPAPVAPYVNLEP